LALRIAVLIKQVPRVEEMELGPGGVLRRDGLDLEMNAYCRRAVSKGTELAKASGGSCTVFTLGPPAAEDSLREAVAWGADRGVLITDPSFAGSDTLATARALAAALRSKGPFDLILTGRNSVDADTGQVGPCLAELLDLPFLGGVKVLEIDGRTVSATCEQDDRMIEARTYLPAVLSCAERLCDPSKVAPEGRAAVAADRLEMVTADELGAGPWGQLGSPTVVGQLRVYDDSRAGVRLEGPVAQQVREAVELLDAAGALAGASRHDALAPVADGTPGSGPLIGVLIEPGRPRVSWELLGAAGALAARSGGRVVAFGLDFDKPDADELGRRGADELTIVQGAVAESDVAAALAEWCQAERPWAVLAAGTMWGREVAARVAGRLGAGLVGDAVELTVEGDRLVAWKPAFGGKVVAAITSSSQTQLVTVRPGVLGLGAPRPGRPVPTSTKSVVYRRLTEVLSSHIEDEMDELAAAACVIGVGRGIAPHDYVQLDPLRRVLGAELAATRKVTDVGWLPHARQVGITGRSLAPQLYVAIGMSGKFNHMVGVRRAGFVLAINSDPEALVFSCCDAGIVGDWREVVPILAATLEAGRPAADVAGRGAAGVAGWAPR
jgi:electron transfer flavoprotein alpha subunit